MSFKFPSFNLQSIQDTISNYDFQHLTETTGKTYQELSKSIQPFTNKTSELLSNQLQQIQQFANQDDNIEVSELPKDYLELEANCDLLLNLYTDLIQFTNDTYGKVSYDYPPGNNSLVKLKDNVLSGKFNQLKNVSSPQELENILLGKEKDTQNDQPSQPEDEANIQVVNIPKTLYGQLSKICEKHSTELKKGEDQSPLEFALLKISSNYLEIAASRLDMDKKIMNDLNLQLVHVLNEEFIKVNELRKNVYSIRSDFDIIRSKISSENQQEEENDELIKKEDELVSATEVAVIEMKKLLKPSKSMNLLKVFLEAQKEWFDLSSKKLSDLLTDLNKIDVNDDDE